jgi:hypothetical protein
MKHNAIQQARMGAALLMTGCILAWGFSPEMRAAPPPHAGPKPANSIDVVPTITSIDRVNGGLVASGIATAVINGKTVVSTFTAPLDISLAQDQTGAGVCPILSLELGPIFLDLLGLVVETSPICLTITAYEGGGLLGDLLCAVANLLGSGLTLNQALDALDDPVSLELLGGGTPELLAGLTNLFNEALPQLLNAILTAIFPGGAGTCDILYLELGPLNLTLLGLEVILDDCEGGPVVVEITGRRGALLGNLLCGLLASGQFDLGATLQQIIAQLLGLLG